MPIRPSLPAGLCALLLLAAGCATRGPVRDFQSAARRNPDKAAVVEGFLSKAGSSGSGYAALADVLRFWGRPVPVEDVETWHLEQAPTPDTRQAGELYAAEFGLWALAAPATPDQLKMRIRGGTPVIVILCGLPRHPPQPAFAVVSGFDESRAAVLCHGVADSPVIGEKDFLDAWRRGGSWMMTVRPPDDPPWPMDREERLSRARFFERRRDCESAIRDYETVLEAGSLEDTWYIRLGNSYRACGRTAEAEKVYRRLIEADPRNARACNNLAFLLAEERRNLEEAIELARRAVSLEPANPLSLDTLGLALLAGGQPAEAADILERARARARWTDAATQIEIALHLALAHMRNGQRHLARQVLDDAVGMNPATRIPDELQPLLTPPP